MQNHLPQLPAGAQRVLSFEVQRDGGSKEYVALYRKGEEITALIDSFRDGAWDSVLLPPSTIDALRKGLNRVHRERNR